jgi:hypothetical protein
MPRELRTSWNRIGRSGDTIDGREIKDQDIIDASETYNRDFYTSMVWPEHDRYLNLGIIDQVKHEKNSEGGFDLFAIFVPNDFYISSNERGQRLFTSMELTPNFRKSGRTYLSGIGATDEPASVATSEVRFSKNTDPTILLGDSLKNNFQELSDDQPPSWFAKFFNNSKNETDEMDKKALLQLQEQLTALTAQFALLKPAPVKKVDDKAPTDAEKFTALTDQVAALATKFKTLEASSADDSTDDTKVAALQTALDDLTAKFTAALKETPGTKAGENTGDGTDLNEYV